MSKSVVIVYDNYFPTEIAEDLYQGLGKMPYSWFDKRIKYHILDKKGKGRAIRFGLNNSQYENVLLFDSDFAYDFHDIKNFITEDTSLTPFLVGTRYLDQNDKTSKTRKLFGKIYNKIFNFLFQK